MKKISILLALLLMLSMVSGCGPKGNEVTGNVDGNKDKVVLVLDADIGTLNPLQSASTQDLRVYCNIYDTLFTMDDNGNFVPSLAERWDISDDEMKYTFHLREGVKFHNGDELKASDVVFSFNSAKESPYLEGQFLAIKDAVALDNHTVEVNLNYPYAPFLLSILDQLVILNEKVVTEEGDSYGENPVGTGPYKFVRHDVGEKIVLERNDDYFMGKAPIKEVEFKVITDTNTALIALETGDVDFLYEIPMISVPAVKENKALKVNEYNSIQLAYMLMNNEAEPFNNKLLRQAINYAIDRDNVINIVVEGMGRKYEGVLSEDIFGYSDMVTGYEYDVERAKELLIQSGYSKGLEIDIKAMDGPFKKAAELIQENLRAVGITAEIELQEKNAYIQDLASGNYESGIISVSVGKDADFYGLLFGTGQQANFSRYSNPAVDDLFEEGRRAEDTEKRLQIYNNVFQAISDDAVIVPLYYPVNVCVSDVSLNVGIIDPQSYTKVYEMSWK